MGGGGELVEKIIEATTLEKEAKFKRGDGQAAMEGEGALSPGFVVV